MGGAPEGPARRGTGEESGRRSDLHDLGVAVSGRWEGEVTVARRTSGRRPVEGGQAEGRELCRPFHVYLPMEFTAPF